MSHDIHIPKSPKCAPSQASMRESPHIPNIVPDTVRHLLEGISLKQQNVAASRRNLLLKREEYRRLNKDLHLKRVEANNAESTFMDLIRQVYYKEMKQFPDDLRLAFEKVEGLRTQLGVLQHELTQIESSLTGAEWVFMAAEEEFYQFDIEDLLANDAFSQTSVHHTNTQLAGPDESSVKICQPLISKVTESSLSLPPGSTGIIHSSAEELLFEKSPADIPNQHVWRDSSIVEQELLELKKTFVDLRAEQMQRSPSPYLEDLVEIPSPVESPQLTDFEHKYFPIVGSIAHREAELAKLRATAQNGHFDSGPKIRKGSKSLLNVKGKRPMGATMTKSVSDSGILALSSNTDVGYPIQKWLLSDLEENSTPISLYMNILETFGIKGVEGSNLSAYWYLRPDDEQRPATKWTKRTMAMPTDNNISTSSWRPAVEVADDQLSVHLERSCSDSSEEHQPPEQTSWQSHALSQQVPNIPLRRDSCFKFQTRADTQLAHARTKSLPERHVSRTQTTASCCVGHDIADTNTVNRSHTGVSKSVVLDAEPTSGMTESYGHDRDNYEYIEHKYQHAQST